MKKLSLGKVRTRTRGECLDFLISGKSILLELERRGMDFVPRLGTDLVPTDVETRSTLLVETDGDTPSGRVALYVCPECGDYGCGVVSAKIERDGDTVVWSEFGQENNYDDEFHPLARIGPYRFEWNDYRQAVCSRPSNAL